MLFSVPVVETLLQLPNMAESWPCSCNRRLWPIVTGLVLLYCARSLQMRTPPPPIVPTPVLGSANLGTSVPRYGPVLAVPAAGPRDHQLRPWLLLLRAHYSALLNHLVWCAHAAWRSARIQLLRARTALLAQPVPSASLPVMMRAPFYPFVKFEFLTVLNVKRTKREIQFLLVPRLPTRGYHYPEAAGLSSDRALLCQLRSSAACGTLRY